MHDLKNYDLNDNWFMRYYDLLIYYEIYIYLIKLWYLYIMLQKYFNTDRILYSQSNYILDSINGGYMLVFGSYQWELCIDFWILSMEVIYWHSILDPAIGISMILIIAVELYVFYFELDIYLCKYMNIWKDFDLHRLE